MLKRQGYTFRKIDFCTDFIPSALAASPTGKNLLPGYAHDRLVKYATGVLHFAEVGII